MRRNQRQGLSRPAAGAILVAVVVAATYFGFTKSVPFLHHFEIKADFKTSNNLRIDSPVRIAGVNVGKVTAVEPVRKGQDMVRVTMRIDDTGRPIHKDATLKIRPRIFLEGNFFVDLKPGTPAAATLGDGDTIPASQTASPVQLDQILTALQYDTRENLKKLLAELSAGLSGRGAGGFNRSIQYWLPAFKNSAIVNEAMLGLRPHDLSGYVRGMGTTAAALDRDPQALKDLITDFNRTAAAFARQQSALEQTVAELPRTLRAANPAFASLNRAFPPLRRLVVDLRPAVRSSGPTLDASLPFIRQARRLVSPSELRGLTADLRPTVPALARLNAATVPLLQQVRLAASCQNQVVLPWSHMTTPDAKFPARGEVYQEGVKFLPGLGGESRSGDANGQWVRVLGGNGTSTYALGQAGGTPLFGNTNFPLQGVNPPPSKKPPFRPDVPCETQQPPDLRTMPGQAPPVKKQGSFSGDPKMQRLMDANRFEGVAVIMAREGHPQAAQQWYERACTLRKPDLLGKQVAIESGNLVIRDRKKVNGADIPLTPGGAPIDTPGLEGTAAADQKTVCAGVGGGR